MKYKVTYEHIIKQVWEVEAENEVEAEELFNDGVFDDENLLSEDGLEINIKEVELDEPRSGAI